jgi:hypothetical protein
MALSLSDPRLKGRVRRTGTKMTKARAGYKKSDAPMIQSCGICEYFVKPDTCKLIEGEIMPEYGCKLFELN